MNSFSSINVDDLVRRMFARKRSKECPSTLLLGAGVSISKNVSKLMEQVNQFLVDGSCVDSDEITGLTKEERFEIFFQKLESLDEYDQRIWLSEGFNNIEPSPGYQKLTRLIEKGYFECILTTNWDNLLDVCLESSPLIRNKDYRIYIHGVTEETVIIRDFKKHRLPRIKVLKLNGDLAYKIFHATPVKACRFPEKMEALVSDILSKNDVIMIGCSVVERNIQKYIKPNDNSFVSIDAVSNYRNDFGENFKSCCYVPEEKAGFEDFMRSLYGKIMKEEEPEPVFASALRKTDEVRELDSSLKKIVVLLQKINEGIQKICKDTERK